MVTKFRYVYVFAFVIGLFAMLAFTSALEPNGATVTPGTPSTSPNDGIVGNASAYAGNITELSIFGISTTQAWQGFYGNVSGIIQLADSSNNVMYNWSIAQPGGEVYASTNSTISWANIQCFNFTANGSLASTGETAGATNLGGYNLTTFQESYGINETDVDSINNTFLYLGGSGHNEFFTANKQFSAGECPNARIFDSSGSGVDGNFEEAMLYEPISTSVIFASILEKDLSGYDSATHDFEMLVPENGHNGDASSTLYFFFVELG